MSNFDAPAERYTAVTPSDSTVYACRAIYVGVTGNLAVKANASATAVTFSNVAVGYHPINAYIIMSTNTTATGIVALY